jgi:hypothetical protein
MRAYLKRRRHAQPTIALRDRAKQRARRSGAAFSLRTEAIPIPASCPALGIPIVVGETRSKNSPSLDRINPTGGYVEGNVRVLSDHANRLKSNLTQRQLEERARNGAIAYRDEYQKLAAYAEREALLAEVRLKAAQNGKMGAEWTKIADFLERRFREWTIRNAH